MVNAGERGGRPAKKANKHLAGQLGELQVQKGSFGLNLQVAFKELPLQWTMLTHQVFKLNWIYVFPGPILLAAIAVQGQEPASPVFQNHKTKEWTNLDNITFSFDCKRRSVGFYADMEYNCQVRKCGSISLSLSLSGKRRERSLIQALKFSFPIA